MSRQIFAELETAHRYVGRFMWAFANVERDLDQILIKLFGLNNASSFVLLNSLDFRKKMNIANLGLSRQLDTEELKRPWEGAYKKLHALADTRNIVAHSPYLPEDDGITFAYAKATTGKQPQRTFTYAELDDFWNKARFISECLCDVERTCRPMDDDDFELRDAIVAEIGGNVLPFPPKD